MKSFDNSFGKAFPPTMVYAGYFAMAIGLLALLGSIVVAVILMLGGAFVGFTYNGIEIDPTEKKFREYARFLGIKFGKWKSYDKYPFISILRRNFTTTAYSRANIPSTTSRETYYDIFLLTNNHRGKLMVQRSTTQDQALWAAQDLAATLGVEYTAYNPAISARTRSRIRSRR